MKLTKKNRRGHRSSWDASFVESLRKLDAELAETDLTELAAELEAKYVDNDSGQSGAISVDKLDKFRALYIAGELDEDPADVFARCFNLVPKTAQNSVTGFIRLLKQHCPDVIE